ncbi:MAG: CinA family protein [Chloroflexota bacterium]|nr:CinA family protein [Chloroflexota bacterium]
MDRGATASHAPRCHARSTQGERLNTHPNPVVPPEIRLNTLLGLDQRLRIAVAESCTGGAIAQRITAIAGSSAYFLGGIVAYANSAKQTLLGVPVEVLEEEGAVSDACAQAMAQGARRAFTAEIAVATTGIAGPGGATKRKPVGLVYIAVASPVGSHATEYHFAGDRAAVITAATETALALLVTSVEETLAQPF